MRVRSPIVIVVAAVAAAVPVTVLTGCQRERSTAPAEKRPAAPRAAAPAAKPAQTGGKPMTARERVRQAITPAARGAYWRHLKRGRALARRGLWPEAAKAFEQALEQIPMDSRALGELGWAAFKAGDLDRAHETNRQAVLAATDPRVRAAALYNLGRTAEARGDKKKAVGYYRASLLFRPHPTVERRLVALPDGQLRPPSVGLDASLEDCTDSRGVKAICACFEQLAGEDVERGCETHKTAERVRVLRVKLGSEVYYHLLGEQPAGWTLLGSLGHTYNPGLAGIYEELELDTFALAPLGKQRILRVETTHQRSDSDPGISELEFKTTKTLTVCVVPRDSKQPVRCPLHVATHYAYERLRDGEPPTGEARAMATKGLPIRRTATLEVKLSATGEARVVLKAGSLKAVRDPRWLGTHRLW